jgi:hypothetical protein
MAWGRLAGALAVALLVACNRRPQPVYEYGETVTLTSTEKDGAPAPARAGAPRAPAPRDPAIEDAAVPTDGSGREDAAVGSERVPRATPAAISPPDEAPEAPFAEDEWTTTVQTDAPPARRERLATESEPAPEQASGAGDAPSSASDAPATPRQWYRAKSW